MVKQKTISLVIPCKNEAESLPRLLSRIPSYIDEVIVVDNNSSDDTSQVAQKLGAKVLLEKRHDSHGIGYGYAHQKGLRAATGDYIVTMDGDGTYPLKSIKSLISQMEKQNLDFISGTRFPLKNPQAISKIRQLGVAILNIQTSLLYQYPVQDILSGMWIIRRDMVKKVVGKAGGWDFSPEIKLNALIHPAVNFAEIHIDHHYRDNGASKQQLFKTGWNHLKFIMIKGLIEGPTGLKFQSIVKSLNLWFRFPFLQPSLE